MSIIKSNFCTGYNLVVFVCNIYSIMYSNELFQKFCKDRNIKKSTRKGYDSALKKYVDFHEKSIDFLLDEAIAEENERIPLKDRKLKKRLVDFRTSLINSTLSPNSSKTYFSKIKTFYMHFEIQIPYLPRVKFDKNYEVSYFDLPSREHIAQAVEIVSIDLKAIILFMASSGTAKAETLSLTIDDFIKATADYHKGGSVEEILNTLANGQNIVPTFYLKRIKTDKYYYTFCSAEATDAIVKYLKTRVNLTPEDKLFDFTSSGLINKFREINDKMNWGFKGNYRFFRTHSLRKFHASNIGLASDYVDALQGRSKNIVHETYIKTNPQKLKEMYESVMMNVTIHKPGDVEEIKQDFTIVINVFLAGKEFNII